MKELVIYYRNADTYLRSGALTPFLTESAGVVLGFEGEAITYWIYKVARGTSPSKAIEEVYEELVKTDDEYLNEEVSKAIAEAASNLLKALGLKSKVSAGSLRLELAEDEKEVAEKLRGLYEEYKEKIGDLFRRFTRAKALSLTVAVAEDIDKNRSIIIEI
ncbi:MAG: hypothetical protein GXO07_03130 [Crenarchaeota archaeon]|nr:hypothetical protein [Thermoproteota archaeon]